MSQPFVGEIRVVPFNFAPQGWMFCDGALLAISENATLFNLIGTTYGGDGRTTFALPNLMSRIPIGTGSGAGLSSYVIGENGGEETVAINVNQLPRHGHSAHVGGAATSPSPLGNFPAVSAHNVYAAGSASFLAGDSVSAAGGGQPHNNVQPYLAVNFIISLFGVYPSQD